MAAVAFNLDEEEIDLEHDPLECECGRPKSAVAHACLHCTYLDGHRNAALVISALRQLGPMSTREITEAIGGRFTETIQRVLKAMLKRGRVRRYWREGDLTTRTTSVYAEGGTRGNMLRQRMTVRAAHDGCWVYSLTEAA